MEVVRSVRSATSRRFTSGRIARCGRKVLVVQPGEDPVPAGLNWDAWIGPAPMRPFKDGVYHLSNWAWLGRPPAREHLVTWFLPYNYNVPVMAWSCGIRLPLRPSRTQVSSKAKLSPGSSSLMFEFPKRGNLPACNFHWYDGGNLPENDLISQGFPLRIPGTHPRSNAKAVARRVVRFSWAVRNLCSCLMIMVPSTSKLPGRSNLGFQEALSKPSTNTCSHAVAINDRSEFVSTIKGEYKPGTMSNFGYAGPDRNDPGRQPRHACGRRPTDRVGCQELEEHQRTRCERIRATHVS